MGLFQEKMCARDVFAAIRSTALSNYEEKNLQILQVFYYAFSYIKISKPHCFFSAIKQFKSAENHKTTHYDEPDL